MICVNAWVNKGVCLVLCTLYAVIASMSRDVLRMVFNKQTGPMSTNKCVVCDT